MKLSVFKGLAFILLLSFVTTSAAADNDEKKHRRWKDKAGPHQQIVQEFCISNPEDARCKEITQRKEQRRAHAKACRENPAAEGCEDFQRRMERRKQKCAVNPEISYCKRFQ